MKQSELIVKLSAPYTFEGETVNEIDLSAMETIRGVDMVAVKNRSGTGKASPLPEMTMEFSLAMAAQVTEKPIEFFDNLPGRAAIRVKNAVTSFFFGDD